MVWTQGLNPEQVQAVEHNQGPLLILAGAGSGKTTVLVSRTGRLIADCVAQAQQICVLTFTNKAARELKHRVSAKMGEAGKGLWAGTFHSFGLQLLKIYHDKAGLSQHFGVIDQSDSQALLKELLKDHKVVGKDKFDLDRLLNLVNKKRLIAKSQWEHVDEYHEVAEMILPKYLRKMELLGVVDFESLILKPIELFNQHPEVLARVQEKYQQLMVDEFQDTNAEQMKLIDLMAGQHRNLTVVGDDDQSIYGWRGAQVSNILDFPKKYQPCKVVRLERNYRSAPSILELANEIIKKNKHRHGKILKPEGKKQGGLPEIFLMENEEVESEFIGREIREVLNQGYGPGDIAVLYRSNSQSGLIESVLRRENLPYTVSGGTAFFDRKEVKDVLAYLRLAVAPNDVVLRRIINTPARGFGDTSLEKLIAFSQERKISFYKACLQAQGESQVAHEMGLQDKASASLRSLFQFVNSLSQNLIHGPGTPSERLVKAFTDLGYREHLLTTSSNPEAGEKRWILVEILGRIFESFMNKAYNKESGLREFVEAMELRDDQAEEERSKINLMTLHACKGLEFPVVFIVGVEEDLLPHRTLGSDVDEERRLFYVGLTRAQNRLTLSYCKTRKRNGRQQPITPSRFLLEMPPSLIVRHQSEYRPVKPEERESLVSGFLSGLSKKIEERAPAKKI